MVKSMMIVGVGGQGSLLASRLIGNALLSCGYDVKLSEVHGMSQRCGSVVTYVKWGDKVHSPIVEVGEADFILSFELLEAARQLKFLKKGGKLVTSTQQIMPMPVIAGEQTYPEELEEKLKQNADVVAIDALSLATKAGSVKAANVVLMGVVSKMTDISEEVWLQALEKTVIPSKLEINKRAFSLGRSAANMN